MKADKIIKKGVKRKFYQNPIYKKKLCHFKYSKKEKEKIFLSDNGRKCQTCHKLKINKKLLMMLGKMTIIIIHKIN